ncbi:MAG: type I-G CRISPR-associated protein Csb2 [Pyrinomonadaceae bacterium]
MLIESLPNIRVTDTSVAIWVEGSPATICQFALRSTLPPLVTHTLPFAEQIRRALIRNRVATSHSEAITGKRADGMPLEGHEHAHYFATDEDGDGRLDHVTIYCPRGFDEADVEALGSLRTIYRRGNRAEVRMVLIGLGTIEHLVESPRQHPEFTSSVTRQLPPAVLTSPPSRSGYCPERPPTITRPLLQMGLTSAPSQLHPNRVDQLETAESGECPETTSRFALIAAKMSALPGHTMQAADESVRARSKIFATSTRWRSVTPFSLPRFPNRGGGKPPRPRDLPEGQLIRELRLRGLPAPTSIKRIEGYRYFGERLIGGGRDQKAEIRGQEKLICWREFHTQRFNGTHGNGLAGFEIKFAEEIAGPLALGFGCHFGLGLFVPC